MTGTRVVYPMVTKKLLNPRRVRKIAGSFAFIEHRFLRHGYWESLNLHELVLYFFLIMVADRNGLSYYSYDKICSIIKASEDDYILARNRLIEKDLIAFDGYFFQVLSLPQKIKKPSDCQKRTENHDFVSIGQIINKSFKENNG